MVRLYRPVGLDMMIDIKERLGRLIAAGPT
jgi:hypothetical protein